MQQSEKIQQACQALTVSLPDGAPMPRLGQGTWHIGENTGKHTQEVEALRHGIQLGVTLIDTAEMYGEGLSETLIGEAIQNIPRESLFLVSKVYPHNAGRKNIFKSCDASLKRLGVDTLDLYLLHWRGSVPLTETVECMEELVQQGKIRRWGVSNFDTEDMEELWSVPNGNHCSVNQVMYHLGSRGIEYDLLPWQQERKVPLMAYCPLAQGGRLLKDKTVLEVAEKNHATASQILLRFLLHSPYVIAIPKAGSAQHALENAQAACESLSEEDYQVLSRAFPAPNYKTPLDMR